jgi:hypothetical protein
VEDVEGIGDINRAWDTIREHKNFDQREFDYCELKHHKPWFDEECSKLPNQRKQSRQQ